MDIDTIIVALGALGGLTGLAALINSLTSAQSSSVENVERVVGMLNEEIVRLRHRIIALEDKSAEQALKIEELEVKVAHWRASYYKLCDWVRDKLGVEPFEEIDT